MPKPFKGVIKVDVRESVPDWDPYVPPRAPEGAPNVLIVLYDDTGLAAWSPFGGRIRMPTLQRLADNGLMYSQWHTTALCSPTRSCFLTGRNHRTPHEILAEPRPQPEPPRETYVYFPDTAEVPESVAVNTRSRSFKILAEVELTSPDAEGVIFAHGSRFGGHALFLKEQKLWYVYNFLGVPPQQQFVSDKLAPGKYVLGMEFTKESTGEHGEALGTTKLHVDGQVVAEGPMRTQLAQFTLCGDGLCIGRDSGDAVSGEYKAPATFKGGTILQVEVNVGDDQYVDLEKEAAGMMARE